MARIQLTFTCAALAVVGIASAQSAGLKLSPTNLLPKAWGNTYKATIRSKYLNETRTVNLFVPASFNTTKRKYPVIFLSDGEYNFEAAAVASYELEQSGHIPECIVAAIETPHRTQDLTPPGMGKFLAEGEEKGEKFLQFISKELRPALDLKLRSSNPNVLVGHSHGGILAHYAAATHRKEFPFILALDAPMHLENAWLVKKLDSSLQSGGNLRLVSLENRFGWQDADWNSFVSSAPKSWHLFRQKLSNETHQSMVFSGLYLGLEQLFGDFSVASVKDMSAPKAYAHYESLVKDYGAFVTPPQDVLQRAVDEITITGDGAAAHRALNALSNGYGPPENFDAMSKRIDVAAAKMKGQPSVDELQSMPKPTEEEMKPFLGIWDGTTTVEDGPTIHVTVSFSMKDGHAVGALTMHAPADEGGDHTEELSYIKVQPNGIDFGFLNGIFPQAIVDHMGRLKNGKLVGTQKFAGVYFVPIFGEPLPKWSFSLEHRNS